MAYLEWYKKFKEKGIRYYDGFKMAIGQIWQVLLQMNCKEGRWEPKTLSFISEGCPNLACHREEDAELAEVEAEKGGKEALDLWLPK